MSLIEHALRELNAAGYSEESEGISYTSAESRVPVVFPYTPSTEYINCYEDGQ